MPRNYKAADYQVISLDMPEEQWLALSRLTEEEEQLLEHFLSMVMTAVLEKQQGRLDELTHLLT